MSHYLVIEVTSVTVAYTTLTVTLCNPLLADTGKQRLHRSVQEEAITGIPLHSCSDVVAQQQAYMHQAAVVTGVHLLYWPGQSVCSIKRLAKVCLQLASQRR
jgi:hypothetical protein